MKASVRSRFHPSVLDACRNRRALRERLKPWWRRNRCCCEQCLPWLRAEYSRPWQRRSFELRFASLAWLELLAPFAPRLRGPLADLSGLPWTPDTYWDERARRLPFISGLELDVVAADAHDVVSLLARLGCRCSPGRQGAFERIEVDDPLDEQVDVWLRFDPADDAPPLGAACTASELKSALRADLARIGVDSARL